MMGLSIWHLIILLVVVVLVFGTKKLSNAGKDLGAAVKGFKDGMSGDQPQAKLEADPPPARSASVTRTTTSSPGQKGTVMLRSTHQQPAVKKPRRMSGQMLFQQRIGQGQVIGQRAVRGDARLRQIAVIGFDAFV